jgi:glycosyltransferase involved in cell wall biosynthesis
MSGAPVLCLTFWYPSKINKSFGIFIKRHVHAISLHHEVTVISFLIQKHSSLYNYSSEVFTDENGVETHQLVIRSRLYKLFLLLLPLQRRILIRYIRRHLPNRQFPIVHSHVLFPCAVVGVGIARHLRARHYISEHWTKIDKFFTKSGFADRAKKTLDSAAGISCVSEQLKTTLSAYTQNRKISVIPNVVSAKEFYYEPGISKNGTLTFIAVAHWAQYKNPFLFLDALQELMLQKKLPEFCVLLVGTGEKLDKVRSNNYGFTIKYAGQLGSADLRTAFNGSDFFLHGSEFETFSVVIAEALLCGLPSVVSPVGIATEVINETNGYVAGNTKDEWIKGILHVTGRNYDRELISSQLKGKFELESVAADFKKFFQS